MFWRKFECREVRGVWFVLGIIPNLVPASCTFRLWVIARHAAHFLAAAQSAICLLAAVQFAICSLELVCRSAFLCCSKRGNHIYFAEAILIVTAPVLTKAPLQWKSNPRQAEDCFKRPVASMTLESSRSSFVECFQKRVREIVRWPQPRFRCLQYELTRGLPMTMLAWYRHVVLWI